MLAACSGTPPLSSPSICDIAAQPSQYEGSQVRLRGYIDVGVEFVRLRDPACKNYALFLHAEKQVNLNGCDVPGQIFGCPFDAERGVRATFSGTFSARGKVGVLKVERISDIAADRS